MNGLSFMFCTTPMSCGFFGWSVSSSSSTGPAIIGGVPEIFSSGLLDSVEVFGTSDVAAVFSVEVFGTSDTVVFSAGVFGFTNSGIFHFSGAAGGCGGSNDSFDVEIA